MKKKPLNLGLVITGCLRGNRASQERLYKQYHAYAMSISLRYAKDRGEAREILNFELDASINTLPILQKLSPAYRIVFNLYVMEGYKHQEIAEQLDISVNTSKSNLARAKQKLKAMIQSRAHFKKLNIRENG